MRAAVDRCTQSNPIVIAELVGHPWGVSFYTNAMQVNHGTIPEFDISLTDGRTYT
jgi:hypothetical protein